MLTSLNSIRDMLNLAGRFGQRPPAEVVQPQAESPKPVGRPASRSLSQTIELLTASPELSSSELADRIDVSRDYARTLLKRARGKLSIVVRKPPRQSTLDELRQSLDEVREQVRQLAADPPPIRRNLHLNNRAAILNLRQQGVATEDIARDLGINLGEVEFVLKVDSFSSLAI